MNISSVMDIYDVKEMFSRYYVDPDIAQQNIPSKWRVKIHDNGKALLLVMVQECKKIVLDYFLNIGSVGMSHIWIELEGPLRRSHSLTRDFKVIAYLVLVYFTASA